LFAGFINGLPLTNGTSHSPRDQDSGVASTLGQMRANSPGQDVRSGEYSPPHRGGGADTRGGGAGSPLSQRGGGAARVGSYTHQRNGSDCDGGGGTSESMPTSPSKQLNKLKRFLSTLQHLGADISPDIGDSVHALVLALVVRYLLAWIIIIFSFSLLLVVYQ